MIDRGTVGNTGYRYTHDFIFISVNSLWLEFPGGREQELIDHLPYIGSWKKPIQEKKGLVWAFSFLDKPTRSCCMGFYPQLI